MNHHAHHADRSPAGRPTPALRRVLLALLAAATLLLPLALTAPAGAHPSAPTISRTNAQSTSAGAHCVNMAISRLYAYNRIIGGYTPPPASSYTFGRDTEAFVRDLQRFGHLTADGIVGRATGSLIWYLWDAQPTPTNLMGNSYYKWQSQPSGFYDYTCYQMVPSRT